MGTRKVIIFCLVGMMMSSCGNKDTSRMDIDELRRECEELREDRAKSLANNVEAQELIDNIFASLNSISGRTSSLERGLEASSKNESTLKAEEIAQDIQVIKEKLEEAAEHEKFDESTKIVISKLKSTIIQKEEEINNLKKEIARKDEQISNLGNKVSSLDSELGETTNRLDQTSAALHETENQLKINEINSWIQMGDELLSTADLLPNVKGHGNMKPIKRAKLIIIQRARDCYSKAYQLGGNSAYSKMRDADHLYNMAN